MTSASLAWKFATRTQRLQNKVPRTIGNLTKAFTDPRYAFRFQNSATVWFLHKLCTQQA